MRAGTIALARCCRGTTAIEFALLAPVFLLMLFGIIEGGRMLWTQHTLDKVAFSTARCMAVDDTCATPQTQRAYAVARARGYGIALATGDVVPASGIACGSMPAASTVTISHAFASPVGGFVPGMPRRLQARSCYPEFS